MPKIFYVTDIHGSEICWMKFLNAGPFYGADVVIVGGDITGKAMVPIVARNGRWETTLQDHHEILESEAEVAEIEKRIMNRGYYPIRVSEEEYRALQEDEDLVDKRFKEAMLEGTERWIGMAEEKFAGTGIRPIACPANDDMFEIDDVLAGADVVETGDEDHPIELDGFTIISMGWTNPTPWHTHREEPDEALAKRLEAVIGHVKDIPNAVFNFHPPPYGSGLDEAPELTKDLRLAYAGRSMVAVGSKAVLKAVETHKPLLTLHGHIHEGKGSRKYGRTLCLNPGSMYEQGILHGALVDLKEKAVGNYVLTTG